MRAQFADSRQHIVRAVNIGIHRRKAVTETFSDEALSRKVIALVEVMLTDNAKDARITLQACRMQNEFVEQVSDPSEAAFRVFEGDAAYKTMDFVTQT